MKVMWAKAAKGCNKRPFIFMHYGPMCLVRTICGENKYLYQINSPKIRTIFTKLRVDSNCTRESKYRSYRGKKSENNLCPHCNVPQDVLHVLIHCDYPAVKRKRESFLLQYICKELR